MKSRLPSSSRRLSLAGVEQDVQTLLLSNNRSKLPRFLAEDRTKQGFCLVRPPTKGVGARRRPHVRACAAKADLHVQRRLNPAFKAVVIPAK
jgi:hypothetical protein